MNPIYPILYLESRGSYRSISTRVLLSLFSQKLILQTLVKTFFWKEKKKIHKQSNVFEQMYIK